MKVRFFGFPSMGDPLTVRTWPAGICQKIFFAREFVLESPAGERYAAAISAWLLIDAQTHRMLMPDSLPSHLPENPGLHAMDEDLLKIRPADGLVEKFSAQAGYSSVDLLGHVNNARYIDWIMDCFSFEHFEQYRLDWLQINFNHEVRAGETVRVFAGMYDDDRSHWLVTGEKTADGEKAFEAELAWESR